MKCIVENCENERVKGRRYCLEHYTERHRQQAKARYNRPDFVRTTYPGVCKMCLRAFNGINKGQLFCSVDCYRAFTKLNTANATNNYENAHGGGYRWMHRRIAESVLDRKLSTNEVVHHVDCKPTNNSIDNLIVMTRSQHVKLHNFLNHTRASLLKNSDVNIENCWNNLIVPTTTAWLETTNAKVIKLSEIGQSAAETLNDKSHE